MSNMQSEPSTIATIVVTCMVIALVVSLLGLLYDAWVWDTAHIIFTALCGGLLCVMAGAIASDY